MIPWVSDGFSYQFKGGLEPGETQHLRLAPNMFGDWSNKDLKGKAKLVLTLSPTNFTGPDGKKLVVVDDRDLAEKKKKLDGLRNGLEEVQRKLAEHKPEA